MTQFNLDLINKWPTFGWPLSSSVAALSVYAVGGFDPKLAFDFISNKYKTGGTDSTLANSVTHTRASQATMADSDGKIKWAPHNLMTYSEDFTHSSWQHNLTLVANATTAPDGTTTAYKIIEPSGLKRGRIQQAVAVKGRTIAVYAKAAEWDHVSLTTTNGSGYWSAINFNLTSGTLAGGAQYGGHTYASVANPTITSVGDGWYLCTVDIALANQAPWAAIMPFNQSGDPVNPNPTLYGDGTSGIYVWGAHVYQSDLGGMVDNPETGDSYVPTTSSAVYLPRVGHHTYNGSAWVNEGILHESEARTNLITNSSDLNTGWSRSYWNGGNNDDIAVSAVTSGSPFGTYQTLEILTTGAESSQRFQIGKTLTSGSTYVGWALAKYSAGSGWFVVNMYDTSKAGENAWFDLQNGVVGSKDALIIDHGMIDYGDGWWLCWASSEAASTSGGVSYELIDADGAISRTAGDEILIAGTQFELGSTPSSYIPTSGATVTRAAETLTVPAANLPYSSTNMSIQMDGKMDYADNNQGRSSGHYSAGEVTWYRWTTGSTNFVYAGQHTVASRTGQMVVGQRVVGQSFYDVTSATNLFTPDINVPFSMATRHGATFINGAEGGTAFTEGATTGIPDVSYSDLDLGLQFMGTIGKFRMWDEDLGDVGIATASAPSTEPSLQLTFDGSSTSSFTVLDWSE